MGAFSSIKWSCDVFEGVALAFVNVRKRKSLNHVRGAANYALRCGATPDELAMRVSHVGHVAYRPDTVRLRQLEQLLKPFQVP
jgi:hypothetical protein